MLDFPHQTVELPEETISSRGNRMSFAENRYIIIYMYIVIVKTCLDYELILAAIG